MKKFKIASLLCIVIQLAGCSIFHSAQSNPTPPVNEAEATLPTTGAAPITPDMPPSEPGQNTLKPIDVSQVNTKDPLIGGATERSMDANDKIKMSKALDKSPGKSTEWTNDRTGITYSVTPIKKVVINNNPFCREYETLITRRANSNTVTGTACIGDDGNWHSL